MYLLTNYYTLRLVKDRPDLSSEGEPHKKKTATFRKHCLVTSRPETTIY
jgi:hypothetical protein